GDPGGRVLGLVLGGQVALGRQGDERVDRRDGHALGQGRGRAARDGAGGARSVGGRGRRRRVRRGRGGARRAGAVGDGARRRSRRRGLGAGRGTERDPGGHAHDERGGRAEPLHRDRLNALAVVSTDTAVHTATVAATTIRITLRASAAGGSSDETTELLDPDAWVRASARVTAAAPAPATPMSTPSMVTGAAM